jgi:hypothetical protein
VPAHRVQVYGASGTKERTLVAPGAAQRVPVVGGGGETLAGPARGGVECGARRLPRQVVVHRATQLGHHGREAEVGQRLGRLGRQQALAVEEALAAPFQRRDVGLGSGAAQRRPRPQRVAVRQRPIALRRPTVLGDGLEGLLRRHAAGALGRENELDVIHLILVVLHAESLAQLAVLAAEPLALLLARFEGRPQAHNGLVQGPHGAHRRRIIDERVQRHLPSPNAPPLSWRPACCGARRRTPHPLPTPGGARTQHSCFLSLCLRIYRCYYTRTPLVALSPLMVRDKVTEVSDRAVTAAVLYSMLVVIFSFY